MGDKGMKEYCFGIDVGGTTVKMGLFRVDGELLEKWEIPSRTENEGRAILPDIAEAVQKKLEEAGWTVIRLTPEQQNAFAEKGRKASWPELKKAIGDKAYEEVISTFVLE